MQLGEDERVERLPVLRQLKGESLGVLQQIIDVLQSPCSPPVVDWQAYFDANPDDIIWDGGQGSDWDFQGMTAEQWAASVGLDIEGDELETSGHLQPIPDQG